MRELACGFLSFVLKILLDLDFISFKACIFSDLMILLTFVAAFSEFDILFSISIYVLVYKQDKSFGELKRKKTRRSFGYLKTKKMTLERVVLNNDDEIGNLLVKY